MAAGLPGPDTAVPTVLLRTDPNVMHHGALGVVRSLGARGVAVHATVEHRLDAPGALPPPAPALALGGRHRGGPRRSRPDRGHAGAPGGAAHHRRRRRDAARRARRAAPRPVPLPPRARRAAPPPRGQGRPARPVRRARDALPPHRARRRPGPGPGVRRADRAPGRGQAAGRVGAGRARPAEHVAGAHGRGARRRWSRRSPPGPGACCCRSTSRRCRPGAAPRTGSSTPTSTARAARCSSGPG